ncbi:rRNA bioproteinsis protein rrp36 [Madurella fahalii]|uniref:rRNA biogenesis protein RRP36 n=1 Tax=Madurella fahalii TaxID=1157608 RepID=A0ABQ0GAW7_9PEZI
MSSAKRKMPPASLLQRRVRPRYEPEPESDIEDDMSEAPSEEGGSSLGSEDEEGDEDGDESGSDQVQSDSESGSEEVEDDGEEDEDEGTPHIDASQLSFGALARAHASMTSSSRRQRGANANHDDSSQNALTATKEKPNKKPEKPPHRTSKHAPAEMSSKKPVSRKRDFLTVTAPTQKQQPRDPRFMPLGAGSSASTVAEIKARKAYAFLDEYRESEMQQLRAAIKKTKNAAEKEQLQKALMSMESRKKAQTRKDKERAVIEEHRRQEKELIKQGKKPFYLKRSEQKKRVLVDQFQRMKKGQVDKVIERRRKKIAAKEKKLLPVARRGVEDR